MHIARRSRWLHVDMKQQGRDKQFENAAASYEAELLHPEHVNGLSRCSLLVELHEKFAPSVTERIEQWFAPTHQITLIDSGQRDPSEFPALAGLSARDAAMVISESRYAQMQWAWMAPKVHLGAETS